MQLINYNSFFHFGLFSSTVPQLCLHGGPSSTTHRIHVDLRHLLKANPLNYRVKSWCEQLFLYKYHIKRLTSSWTSGIVGASCFTNWWTQGCSCFWKLGPALCVCLQSQTKTWILIFPHKHWTASNSSRLEQRLIFQNTGQWFCLWSWSDCSRKRSVWHRSSLFWIRCLFLAGNRTLLHRGQRILTG